MLPTDWPGLVTSDVLDDAVDRSAHHQVAQGRRLPAARLAQLVAFRPGRRQLREHARALLALEHVIATLRLGQRRLGGLAPRPRLLDVAGEIAQLPFDRDDAQARIQTLLGQSLDRVELLLEQAMAGAQAVDLGAHGLELFLALLGGLRERLDAALVRLAPAGEQRLLLGDELRPGMRDFRLDHHVAARRPRPADAPSRCS